MMDVRLHMAIGVLILFNALLVAIFTDMRNFWRAELSGARSELRGEFQVVQANTKIRLGELRALIERNHSEMLSRFAGVDARLTRLENGRRILL